MFNIIKTLNTRLVDFNILKSTNIFGIRLQKDFVVFAEVLQFYFSKTLQIIIYTLHYVITAGLVPLEKRTSVFLVSGSRFLSGRRDEYGLDSKVENFL